MSVFTFSFLSNLRLYFVFFLIEQFCDKFRITIKHCANNFSNHVCNWLELFCFYVVQNNHCFCVLRASKLVNFDYLIFFVRNKSDVKINVFFDELLYFLVRQLLICQEFSVKNVSYNLFVFQSVSFDNLEHRVVKAVIARHCYHFYVVFTSNLFSYHF